MKDKFVKKYMRYAKAVAEDQNPCLSRAIGAVIVNPEKNVVVSTGYNGPAKNVPHLDSYEALRDYVYPQLTQTDKDYIYQTSLFGMDGNSLNCADEFAAKFEGCETCPRKLVGAISGARLELCGCAHGERNAIANAAKAGHETFGCYIFCWCGVPCLDCAVSIINSGIAKVYCWAPEGRQVEANAYNFDNSRWQFKQSGVELVEVSKEWVLSDA